MKRYKYKALKINGKRIDEHRFVMEKFLGRNLAFNEIVHHINGDKMDNKLENLEVKQRSEHSREFMTGRSSPMKGITGRLKDGKYKCSICKKYYSKEEFHKQKGKCHGITHLCKYCKSKKNAAYRNKVNARVAKR